MKPFKQIFVILFLGIFLASCSGAKSKNSSSRNTADGSSIEKAIKVKSVPQEYQIVKTLCPNCKMNGQALISEGNKHYDVLDLTNEKGEVVKYYFDINSFLGKW